MNGGMSPSLFSSQAEYTSKEHQVGWFSKTVPLYRKFWSLGCPMLWAFDFAPDNSQPAIETTDELRHRYGHAMGLDGVSMG